VRDNTARRQELATLRDEALRTARILLLADDAIVSCGADLRISFFNLGAERMFGYGTEEAMGQPLELLLPQAARGRHPALMAAFGAGATPSRMMSERAEVAGRRKGGEEFPVEAAITRVTLGGAISFTAHLRDISARKAAQRALEESERRFRAMFDHAPAAFALLAPDGTVLEINRAGRALTEGVEPLVGRPLWELPWLGAAGVTADGGGRERLKAAVASAAAGTSVRFTAELNDGGSVRRIDLALTPIRDEAGKVVYILPEGREIDGQSA
jgi:PAS domain S-box-containing protein